MFTSCTRLYKSTWIVKQGRKKLMTAEKMPPLRLSAFDRQKSKLFSQCICLPAILNLDCFTICKLCLPRITFPCASIDRDVVKSKLFRFIVVFLQFSFRGDPNTNNGHLSRHGYFMRNWGGSVCCLLRGLSLWPLKNTMEPVWFSGNKLRPE